MSKNQKNQKNLKNYSEKFFYISGNRNFLAPNLRSSYIFSTKSFSYISGRNLQSLKNQNFLYFSISSNSLVFLNINLHLIFFIRISFLEIFSLESLESLQSSE